MDNFSNESQTTLISNVTTYFCHCATPPCPASIGFTIASCLLFACGMMANAVTLIFYLNIKKDSSTSKMKTPHILLVVPLAFEMIRCSNFVIVATLSLARFNFTLRGENWDFMCRVIFSGNLTNWFFQTNTLASLLFTGERYAKIIHPIWHMNNNSPRLIKVLIITCLVLTFPTGLLLPCLTTDVQNGSCGAYVIWPKPWMNTVQVVTVTLLLMTLMPTIVMGYLNFHIMRRIRQLSHTSPTSALTNNQQNGRMKIMTNTKELDIAKVMLMLDGECLFFLIYHRDCRNLHAK